MSKSVTVRALAEELNSDVEDVLLTLWDAGIDRPTSTETRLNDREVKAARVALGLARLQDFAQRAYWQEALSLDDAAFDDLLVALKIPVQRTRKTLPKGAPKRLRAYAHSQQLGQRSEPARAVEAHVQVRTPPHEEPMDWQDIGRERTNLRYLTQDEILEIHYCIAREFRDLEDPIFPAGLRDENLLGSAVSRPFTSHGSTLKYPTIEMAAAALLHGLVMDHPFHNGNKRTGLVAMLVFLDENGLVLTCTEKELFRFVLRLARHGLTTIEGAQRTDQEVLKCALWILDNDRAIEKSERPLQWRQVRRALSNYNVTFDFKSGDNCMMLTRRVTRPARFFGKESVDNLHIQATYKGEGQELPKRNVSALRHALELDDEHGVDSQAFYADAGLAVDGWINQYRQTLKRLAKM